MTDLPSVKMKKRANLIIMIGTLLFAAMVVANLFKIMVLDSEEYQKKADENQFADMAIPANRGSIYSSDGKILAQSATVFRIFLDPSLFLEHDQANEAIMVDYLSKALNISPEKITKAMTANTQYEIIAKQIEKPLKNEIMDFATKNDIKSIFAEEDTKRYYPQDNLAASVIGFTNSDGEGQYGVEASYDEYLAGVDGVIISAKDAFGDQMPYRHSKLYEAKDGNSIVLTIDTMIQYYVESALNSAVEKFDTQNRGCAIAMNAKTGAILAMATSPGYDLNNKTDLSEKDQAKIDALPADQQNEKAIEAMMKMWRNKAVSETYEPGSVFKVFTSAAAFEEKVLSFNDSFECNGAYNVEGTSISCWKTSGHGTQIFKEALKNSCNPAFIQIGLKLGAEKFSYYADAFGLREKTGIDLPGEENSIFLPLKGESGLTNKVNLASSAFGQTNKLTPIQMITGYAAVINGGRLVTPYVVDKIIDSDGNTVKATEPTIKRQVISEDTSAKMREALQYVVDNNGGSNAYIMGYKIGGKSGTSQKLDDYNKAKAKVAADRKANPSAVIPDPVEQYVGSYCCFAPANDPEIILLVMIDEPNPAIEYYGSKVAVPCAREILTNVLPYMGYYPEYSENEKDFLNVAVPYVEEMPVEDAKAAIQEKGFEADIVGSGSNVVKQVPSFTSSMPAKGKVVLYTTIDCPEDTIIMPDLTGKTLKDVNVILANLGLNCKVEGTRNEDAVVVKQSCDPNDVVSVGTIVSIQLAINDQTG